MKWVVISFSRYGGSWSAEYCPLLLKLYHFGYISCTIGLFNGLAHKSILTGLTWKQFLHMHPYIHIHSHTHIHTHTYTSFLSIKLHMRRKVFLGCSSNLFTLLMYTSSRSILERLMIYRMGSSEIQANQYLVFRCAF